MYKILLKYFNFFLKKGGRSQRKIRRVQELREEEEILASGVPYASCLMPYALCRRSRGRVRIAAAFSWQIGCRSSLKVNANSLQVTAESLQLSAKSLPSSR